MKYLLSGIELHPDFGFGITGEAYYKSADFMNSHHYEFYESTQQREMPQNFLFRHSIELFLKSLIIIFHKKLKIHYDQDSFESDKPKILIGDAWRPLYSCHWIDELYEYWLKNLLTPNIAQLKQIAPKGDWQESKDITNLLQVICKYDRDSSFFRYPVTKDSSLDSHKFTMKRFSTDTLENFIKELDSDEERKKFGKTIFLKVDGDENVTHAFYEDEKVLDSVTDALREVAYYFYCIHIMTRVTLCDGF